MRLLALLLFAALAHGDASTPRSGGERSPMWPESRDDVFIGVDARGEAAFITQVEYQLPTVSGSKSLLRCRLFIFDATGSLVLQAEQQPALVIDGRVIQGGWQSSKPLPIDYKAGCTESIARLRKARDWAPATPSPTRDDWVVHPRDDEGELAGENLLTPGSAHHWGGCVEMGRGARVFRSTRSKALFVARAGHFMVLPAGWRVETDPC